MAEKNYNDGFLEYVSILNKKNQIELEEKSIYQSQREVSNITLISKQLRNSFLENIAFFNCKFEGVVFRYSTFIFTSFHNCEFINCRIVDCMFSTLELSNVQFIDTVILNSSFRDAFITETAYHRTENKNMFFADIDNVTFNRTFFDDFKVVNSIVVRTHFSEIDSKSKYVRFESSSLHNCKFYKTNVGIFNFESSSILGNSYVMCRLIDGSFANCNIAEDSSYIDLQTILLSNIDENTYKSFGVHGYNPKGYIEDLVTKMNFQTVFISYSFKDEEFARALDHILMMSGVKAWFWERDAPGGKRLKKIMAENIDKHDRLLFIASKNSLKSKACHYELKEGREKQDKEWNDIYFPIHIDDYLFAVRKEDIPRKFREDFWENIEEVKEFNSKDFSMFKTEDDFKSPEFEAAVKQLIKDLKL